MTHSQLQAASHLWFWNTYPEYRYLSHANISNLTTEIPPDQARILMAKLKHLGLVKGVFDYEFYFRGILYAFDFKIGSDKLSEDQLRYQARIQDNGGRCFEIRSFEQFQEIIKKIL